MHTTGQDLSTCNYYSFFFGSAENRHVYIQEIYLGESSRTILIGLDWKEREAGSFSVRQRDAPAIKVSASPTGSSKAGTFQR